MTEFLPLEPIEPVSYEEESLPEDPQQALMLLRVAYRERFEITRRRAWTMAMHRMFDAIVPHMNQLAIGYGVEYAELKEVNSPFFSGYVVYNNIQNPADFTVRHQTRLLTIADIYLRDVQQVKGLAIGKVPVGFLARLHEPNYYMDLWRYYSRQHGISWNAFVQTLHTGTTNPAAALDAYVARCQEKTPPLQNAIVEPLREQEMPLSAGIKRQLSDRGQLTYEVIARLPHPERAAVYIAYCVPWLFSDEMRQEGWMEAQRVLDYFGCRNRAQLITYVQERLMPEVRAVMQEEQGSAIARARVELSQKAFVQFMNSDQQY